MLPRAHGHHAEAARARQVAGLRRACYPSASMPIYEYKCPNGHLLEVFHGMNEPGPRSARCAAPRRSSACCIPVAVHYKGSGFYSTDYGRGRRGGARTSAARRFLGRRRLVGG